MSGGSAKYSPPLIPPLLVDEDGQPLVPLIPVAPKYDPSQFFVAPADAKGVSYRKTFRIPPDMEKGIEVLIASKRFPFQTDGEFLRWAVMRGFRELEAMEPVGSVGKQVEILSAWLTEETAFSEFTEAFQQLEHTVSRYMADSAPEQALRIVAVARFQIEQMPEGYWRDRYLEELHKRFNQLAGHVPALTLVQPKE